MRNKGGWVVTLDLGPHYKSPDAGLFITVVKYPRSYGTIYTTLIQLLDSSMFLFKIKANKGNIKLSAFVVQHKYREDKKVNWTGY